MIQLRRILPQLVLLFVFACTSRESETDTTAVTQLPAARVRLVAGTDTIPVVAELAETESQRTMGLMERQHLGDSAGMLFLYPSDQPATAGFWMFRTRIPLDIAFVDSAGTVRAVQHMVPCPATLAQGCPTYEPGAPYRAALEVNAGYLARHKIDVGSRIILADTSTKAAAAPSR